MNPSLDSLAFELQEKNELISLLTQQLEQAAEQLDRLQRAGEAGRSTETRQKTGLTPAITEGMQHFLAEWDELQPAMALGRIELALAQLQQTLTEQTTHPLSFQTPATLPVRPTEQPNKQVHEHAPEHDFWARMKSQMMETDSGNDDREAPLSSNDIEHNNTAVTEVDYSSINAKNPQSSVREEPFDFRAKRIDEGPDLPPDVDLTSATKDDIQHAFEARDEYISYLHDRLNKAERHEHFRLPNDWNIFYKYPGELRVKLEFLEAQLVSVLRTTEIQQSMERARNARLENKLKFERELISRHAKRLGINLNDDVVPEPEKKKSLREQEKIGKDNSSHKSWSLWGKASE